MYKAFIIIFLSLWSITSQAQLEVNKLYKIYKDDNTVLRGELISEDEDFIEMKLLDATIVKVEKEYIMLIRKYDNAIPKISNYDIFDDLPNGAIYRVSGSYIIFQLGIIPDRSSDAPENNPRPQTTFTLINGYQANSKKAIGLGINFDIYNKSFFPIFIDYRRYFARKPVSFYSSLNTGYALSFEQFTGAINPKQKGGIMNQIGVGVEIATSRKINLLFEICYRMQRYKKRTFSNSYYAQNNYRHLFIQLGLAF